MNLKQIKKDAKHNVWNNYFKNLLVVFVCTLLISGGIDYSRRNILDVDLLNKDVVSIVNNYEDKSNEESFDTLLEKSSTEKEYENLFSSKFTRGFLALLINEITASKSLIFGVLNSLNKFFGGNVSVAVIILISNILLFLITVFFLSVLEIGRNRYFLEQRRYLKTNVESCFYPYRKRRNFRLALILLFKDLYLFLWSFTIIGGIIKYYEYAMIPYVLAENTHIKRKEAFLLSKELMRGNKMALFKLDLSLLVWRLLGVFTFNLSNILFTNIYKVTLYSEFYATIRMEKKPYLTDGELLSNDALYVSEPVMASYPEAVKKKHVFKKNYKRDYSLTTYIMFFFTFSFCGWIWEVLLHLVNYGVLVNRGTLYGPWLPIYGFGGVAILVILKKFRNNYFWMFAMSLLLCTTIEYFTGWYLETFRNLRYWNYTGYFLNLHGRVSLEGAIMFGLGGCGCTYILAPLLDDLYKKINPNIKKWGTLILLVIFVFDWCYSTFVMPNMGKGVSSTVEMIFSILQ